ncbi:hypothetical protein [Rhodococcus sp. UNC363MFTsu5.1]|uniref:hypothetical protein n=1 Tax=Rhodococcus sp. UNC363MFTsu5.1 TaxID=1449069 RepID=UPI0004875424|nr:hypothetical protein [Rhodococcus sp. UNC363MFTsu5.1]
MSLPEPNTAWPPAELAKVQARTAESQVWWEGDPDKLNAYYGAERKASPSGVVGRTRAAYDAFWGRTQTPTAQAPKRYHAPIAGVITKLSASELFNEPVTFVSADDQARADLIFNTPTFHSQLLEAGEQCSALSGSFQRVVWDDTIAENTWLDFVDADRAIPEFRWGRLVAVTFWSELDGSDDRDVWRHLERHESERVIHGLYKGTATSLGRSMDLAAHPATKGIKVVLGADGYSHVETGVKELTAAYVPNVTPNPEWRHEPKLKHLGRADISTDLIPSYHELDRIYSSLIRDFRLGAGKVYASESVLQNLGPGNGATLPDGQEIFTRVGSSFNSEGDPTTLFQFFQPAIRVLEHDQGGNILLREVLRKTGYSPVSLGMSDEVAQTATEASGKKDLTVKTTTAKARHWGSALGPLSTTCLRVDAIKFPGKGKAPTEDLELEWPKFARESDEAKSRTVQGWANAGAASTRTKVAYLHEDWDETKVAEEVELIDKASDVPVPDFGFQPDGPPKPPEQSDESDEPDEVDPKAV